MQQELATVDRSTEFTCPRCGASAFEVTGLKHQVNLDVDATSDRTSFFSMKCMHCLHPFDQEIHECAPLDGVAEPQEDALCLSAGRGTDM